MLDAQDRQGLSLRHVLEAEHAATGGQKGHDKTAEEIAASMALPPGSVREYVEVHIEQVGSGSRWRYMEVHIEQVGSGSI